MRYVAKNPVTPIGVDIGSRTVKAIQLSNERSGWRLLATAEYPREHADQPWSGSESERLRGVLARQGFCGTKVVLAAPAEQLAVDVLDLPPRSSGAPVDQIAHAEMARLRKFEPGSFEMSSWDLPTGARAGATTNVLAVAIRSDDAITFLDLFEEQGLDVVALDTRAWALTRAANLRKQTRAGTTAVLDVGWRGATVALIQDKRVVYQRSLAGAELESLVADLARNTGLPVEAVETLLSTNANSAAGEQRLAEAQDVKPVLHRFFESIASELEASVSYASHRFPESPVSELLVVGGGAGLDGLCSHVSGRLSVPAEPLTPRLLATSSRELAAACSHARMTLALGLALHEEH